MKVVLLAGGLGTRIAEESEYKPKPMIEVGGMPILWHIMKEYSYYGHNEFIICAGYKHYLIKKWFADYQFYISDMKFDFKKGTAYEVLNKHSEPWKVTVIDTGLMCNTGGRIKKVQPYVGDEPFLMTYGDGVCDVDISELLRFHQEHGKIATLTAVAQKQMKGILDVSYDNSVRSFREKSKTDHSLVNAGYMVFQPEIFRYLDDDTVLETTVLSRLAAEGQLMSFNHDGFWQCMDTLPEKQYIERLIQKGMAPWMKWEASDDGV